MTIGPDASRAPGFVGPVPPNQVIASFGQCLETALNILRTRDITPDEIEKLRAFHQAEGEILAEKTGRTAAPAESGPAPSVESQVGPSQDYGTAPGFSPVTPE